MTPDVPPCTGTFSHGRMDTSGQRARLCQRGPTQDLPWDLAVISSSQERTPPGEPLPPQGASCMTWEQGRPEDVDWEWGALDVAALPTMAARVRGWGRSGGDGRQRLGLGLGGRAGVQRGEAGTDAGPTWGL